MPGDWSADQWRRVSSLLDEALDLPAERRPGYLDEACGQDAELRRLAEQMLAAAEAPDGILETPALAGAPSLMAALAGAEATEPTVPPGLQAGPWRLLRELGRGGMGVVYLAERADGQFEQVVALKLIRRGLDSEEVIGRFLRERQILARLEHPSIARLIDGGIASDGRPYFAMEHVEGEPITTWCARRNVPLEGRLSLLLTACDAVQHAHRSLVVHRDLKPSNILVTADGQVKLLDFGIAQLLSVEEEGAVQMPAANDASGVATRAEGKVLTPEYAAPEQFRGAPPTTATDVYGLGMVLYELLAGCRPYSVTGATIADIERQVLKTTLVPPSRAEGLENRVRRRLRGDLDAIALRALRKEPERRYPTTEALARDIRRHRDGLPVAARGSSVTYRATRFVRRHRIGVSAALLVTASLVAGLVGTLREARTATREARKAEEVKSFLVSIFEVSDPSQSRGERTTARELLDRGAERIRKELASEPEVQLDLIAILADVYEKLGLYDQALPLAAEALEKTRSLRGAGHESVAARMRRQGSILVSKGSYDAADPLLTEALARHRRLGDAAAVETAEDLDALGILKRAQGRIEEAERHVRESLGLRRSMLGTEHPLVATSMNNLAVMLREAGRIDEAEPLYRDALAMRRKLLGEDHPDVAVSLNNFAALLRQQGHYEEAETQALAALELNRKLYGDDNLNTITSMNNLAAIQQRLARYDEAEKLHRAVLDFWRRTQGENHPSALVSLNNLASVLRDRGEEAEAEKLFRRLVDTWPRVVGAKHPFLAVSLTHLGAVLRERGDLAGAARCLEQAYEIRKALHGEDHPETAGVLYQRAELARQMGRLDEAETGHRRALEVREKSLGPAHPFTALSRLALGSTLRARGRVEDAVAIQQAGLASLRAKSPPGHPEIGTAELELGRSLAALKRFNAAEPLLRDAVAIRRDRFGRAARLTAEAERSLAECLAARGTGDL